MSILKDSISLNLLRQLFCVGDLAIGGLTPFTTIDFPGRLATVLYTQGCAWDCRYCHNSHLQKFDTDNKDGWEDAVKFLSRRASFLDGVVFCGGEPTAHESLKSAIRQVKGMGYLVALHTSGMYPERFRSVVSDCDWVGMDVKAPFDDYEKITQRAGSGEAVRESVEILVQSKVDYEVRTTVHPDLLSENDIMDMAHQLRGLGVENYTLQAFRESGCRDRRLEGTIIAEGIVSVYLRQALGLLFKNFRIRQ